MKKLLILCLISLGLASSNVTFASDKDEEGRDVRSTAVVTLDQLTHADEDTSGIVELSGTNLNQLAKGKSPSSQLTIINVEPVTKNVSVLAFLKIDERPKVNGDGIFVTKKINGRDTVQFSGIRNTLKVSAGFYCNDFNPESIKEAFAGEGSTANRAHFNQLPKDIRLGNKAYTTGSKEWGPVTTALGFIEMTEGKAVDFLAEINRLAKQKRVDSSTDPNTQFSDYLFVPLESFEKDQKELKHDGITYRLFPEPKFRELLLESGNIFNSGDFYTESSK